MGFKLPRGKGRTTRRVPGEMNKTEARHAAFLEVLRQSGGILAWSFEAVTFKLAKDLRYTPDFMVQLADGTIEFHETKGTFMREDAQVKMKMFAELFPFALLHYTYRRGDFTVKQIGHVDPKATEGKEDGDGTRRTTVE